MLVPCALLLFIALFCSSNSGKEKRHYASKQEEEGDGFMTTSAARVTGTAFLTNVHEIVSLDLTGRTTCMVLDRAGC
jgi:hypothetical protein